MRCPHCGYNSFAHLEHCKKCGRELRRRTAETENHGGNSVAEIDSATVEDEESSSTLAAEVMPVFAELDAGAAEEHQSSTEVGEVEDTPEEHEPALFAGFAFTPSPEPEDEEDGKVLKNRSSVAYPQTGDALSTSEAPFSFVPNPADLIWDDHPETEITSAQPFPADTSPLGKASVSQARVLIGRRLLASVLDITVILIVWLLFYMWGHTLLWAGDGGFLAPLLHSPRARGGFYLLLILIVLAYFTLFHYINGQTPGKMLTKIKVVSCDAKPLTLSQVLLRTCGGFVSALCLGAGYIVIWWARDARGWNDKLADTRVECTSTEDTPTAAYE